MADMTYYIDSGEFYIGAYLLEKGFAGYYNHITGVDFRNNSAFQCIKNRGALPAGRYYMSDGKGRKTKNSIRLTPVNIGVMCNREGFLIHGDNKENPGTGSEGCIILKPQNREKILAAIRPDGTSILEVKNGTL